MMLSEEQLNTLQQRAEEAQYIARRDNNLELTDGASLMLQLVKTYRTAKNWYETVNGKSQPFETVELCKQEFITALRGE